MTEAFSRKTIARVAAVMFLIGGDIVGLAGFLLAPPDNANQMGIMAVGFTAAIVGSIFWFLPWNRWPRFVGLWVIAPTAYTAIASFNFFNGSNPYTLGIFFVTIQTWIGLAYAQGSSLRLLPLLLLAIAVPLRTSGVAADEAAYSVVFTILACLVVGETLAWLSAQLAQALQELRWLVGHDPLTGVANRRLLFQRMEDKQSQRPHAVALVDVNQLKDLNDQWGHAFGDVALIAVARRLASFAKEHDLVARVGGDEFVLLSFSRTLPELQALCDQDLTLPLHLDYMGHTATVTLSYGTAPYPEYESGEEALSRADSLMYQHKRGLVHA